MYRKLSAVWKMPPERMASRFENDMAPLFAAMEQNAPVYFFFRADDIGVPGKNFSRLMEIFYRYRTPLGLAVVPSWITPERWEAFQPMDHRSPELWCWHQHGWRHLNHEVQGKKQEFGPSRSQERLERDILAGCDKLGRILRGRFTPVFTPPWNRCDARTLLLLKHHGYQGISRHCRSLPSSVEGLPDFPVGVDLHTRREVSPEAGWQALCEEFAASAASGVCGVMIHHQRMNASAFAFLELLLQRLQRISSVRCEHWGGVVKHV